MDLDDLRVELDNYLIFRREAGIGESTLDLDRRKVASFLAWLEQNYFVQDLTTVKQAPIVGVEAKTGAKKAPESLEREHTMPETTSIEGTESPEVRAFWPTDYRRFAQVIRTARKDYGDEVADALASPIVETLTADSTSFDADKFMAGTYQVPNYVGALASTLKAATHVKCQPWVAAPADKLAKVEALGASLTETLAAQLPHFSGDTFKASFAAPVPAAAQTNVSADDDDEDDEPGW